MSPPLHPQTACVQLKMAFMLSVGAADRGCQRSARWFITVLRCRTGDCGTPSNISIDDNKALGKRDNKESIVEEPECSFRRPGSLFTG